MTDSLVIDLTKADGDGVSYRGEYVFRLASARPVRPSAQEEEIREMTEFEQVIATGVPGVEGVAGFLTQPSAGNSFAVGMDVAGDFAGVRGSLSAEGVPNAGVWGIGGSLGVLGEAEGSVGVQGAGGFGGGIGVQGLGGNVQSGPLLPIGEDGGCGVQGLGADQNLQSGSPNPGPGVVGRAGGGGSADGVRGFGTGTFSGVAGFGDPASNGTGVFGLGQGPGAPGVRGIGSGGSNTVPPNPVGVYGVGGAGNADGIQGIGTGTFSGVAGFGDPASTGTGVFGAGGGEGAPGVRGIGARGPNTGPSNAAGVYGQGGPQSPGVVGQAGSSDAVGVQGFGSGESSGVAGIGDPASTGTGVFGRGGGKNGIGVMGTTTSVGGIGITADGGTDTNGNPIGAVALKVQNGTIAVTSDSVGKVTMGKGKNTLTVSNAAATANSLILLTPLGNPQAFLWISATHAGSFTIEASTALPNNVNIGYLIIN